MTFTYTKPAAPRFSVRVSATPQGLRGGLRRALIVALSVAALAGANAQVSSINSVAVTPRFYDDIKTATLTVVTNYPALISFDEENVTSTSGFANRDVWHFSNDNGATAYLFQGTDYFTMTMSVTLTGNPASPRKEAGFVFNNPANDGGEFILDTDAHEVVAFGGFLPFYAFPKTFQSGDTIRMGITILKDSNGKNAIIYSANDVSSPPLEFGNTEQGVINNTTIGGYFQIQTSSTSPNSGSVAFANLSIGTPLSIAPVAGNQIVLFWPATATNFVLQSTTNLTSATNWSTVNGAPVMGVTLPTAPPGTYFRLQSQ
jgi:hypothetical protein